MWLSKTYKYRGSCDPMKPPTTLHSSNMADATTAANRVLNPASGGIAIVRASDRDSKHHVEHDELAENEKGLPQDDGPADRFGTNTFYSPEEKKLVRKLDTYIMPIVFCMYFMNKWV